MCVCVCVCERWWCVCGGGVLGLCCVGSADTFVAFTDIGI